MKNSYTQKYLEKAAEVSAAFPDELSEFCLSAAGIAARFDQDAVEVASKRCNRRNKVEEPLQPVTVDYGAGLERSPVANLKIIFNVRK